MKRSLLVLVLMFAGFFAKADQLAVLSRAQAEKAVSYLKKEAFVMLRCGCCDDQSITLVAVSEVFMKKNKDGETYSVIVKGKNDDGKDVEEYVDLAYVWVKKGSTGKCLGKVLKFKCDPCINNFDWEVPGAG
ncbi:MAG: hypothetical protein EOO09_06920 [Chitinophagaceae bacterium]|nr:MAG: hypothetical protein EOO09_06920 [Chitinophagaceae bacterium]